MNLRRSPSVWLPVYAALALLLVLYLTTLQMIPNGSSHYFMIDVGETQIVLNEWGSLHPTGYPLYVVSGNLLTSAIRAQGISPLVAPALVSLFWGMAALLLMFSLGLRLGFAPWLASVAAFLFGLTRTVWVHNVVAEVYSFNLFLLLLLLLLAFSPLAGIRQLYLLALVGGIALGHHRAFLTLVPPLLHVVWPTLRSCGKRLPRVLLFCLLAGLVGLVPYLWPLLRARAGADWVYGDPSTLPALLDVFIGAEYSRFIGPPASMAEMLSNAQAVNKVLIGELSLPGVLVGAAGLLLAHLRGRRPATTLLLVALCAWLFHAALYRDILSALILPITLALAFGWLFLAEMLLASPSHGLARRISLAVAVLLAAAALVQHNLDFVGHLTGDTSGLETISQLEAAPAESTVMLAWGPRYFAASAAQLYQDRLAHLELVDHNGDLRQAFQAGRLITPDYTFFNQPKAWWEEKLGQRVWLEAAGPRLVRLGRAAVFGETGHQETNALESTLHCSGEELVLEVRWHAGARPPSEDLGVFVKAFARNGDLLAQGDQFAPVYGLRPTGEWLPNELIRDFYPVPVKPGQVDRVDFGLYRTSQAGEFENVLAWTLSPACQ